MLLAPSATRQRKIIFFELNEVPLRIFDYFIDGHPESTLARLRGECRIYENFCEDVGSLSPWRTWPTLHRGVIDEKHFIQDFGQVLTDVDQEYPPLWKILSAHGVPCGVFGSLHSYPPPADGEDYAFYVPDTFAAGSECFPKSIEAFQEFNLSMARASGRNVSSKVDWGSAARMLARLPEMGFRFSTLMDAAGQLAAERKDRWRRVRRRTYQTLLAFDIFLRQLNKTKPAFATFFSNHVASSMHRYWAALFPEDYEHFGYDEQWKRTFRNEIDFTMGRTDKLFHRLVQFADRNPDYQIWLLTSMGQAATNAEPLETQMYLTRPELFMERLGVPEHGWEKRPSMLPNANFCIHADHVAACHEALRRSSVNGEPLVFRPKDNGFVAVALGHRNLKPGECRLVLNGEEVSLEDAGMENTEIEDRSNTTAYHVPNGSLIIYDPLDRTGGDRRESVSTLEIAPTILRNFGVAAPDYMAGPAALAN